LALKHQLVWPDINRVMQATVAYVERERARA
jgi:hypothetical protein